MCNCVIYSICCCNTTKCSMLTNFTILLMKPAIIIIVILNTTTVNYYVIPLNKMSAPFALHKNIIMSSIYKSTSIIIVILQKKLFSFYRNMFLMCVRLLLFLSQSNRISCWNNILFTFAQHRPVF